MHTLTSLETVFQTLKRPYFVVYKGNYASKTARKAASPPDLSWEDAYLHLLDVANILESGTYTIALRTSESAGTGEVTYQFNIVNNNLGVVAGIGNVSNTPTTTANNGLTFQQFMDFQEKIAGIREESQKSNTELLMKNLELQNKLEIEKLKMEYEKDSKEESIGDVIKHVVKAVAPALLTKNGVTTPHIGKASANKSETKGENSGKTTAPPTAEEKQNKAKALQEVLVKIAELYPDYDPIEVIQGVTNAAASNPAVNQFVSTILEEE